jgi:hypothetical protein
VPERRIGSDHEQVLARLNALVTGACWQDRYVASLQDERATFRSDKLNPAVAARDD